MIFLNEVKYDLGLDCSTSTISRRLKSSKLVCRVARIKESLSAGHKARRLQFSQDNLEFRHWDKTIFIDQATFETGAAYKTLVRRPIGI